MRALPPMAMAKNGNAAQHRTRSALMLIDHTVRQAGVPFGLERHRNRANLCDCRHPRWCDLPAWDVEVLAPVLPNANYFFGLERHPPVPRSARMGNLRITMSR